MHLTLNEHDDDDDDNVYTDTPSKIMAHTHI